MDHDVYKHNSPWGYDDTTEMDGGAAKGAPYKEVTDAEAEAVYEEGKKLSADSSHQLMQKKLKHKTRSVDWDEESLPHMGHEKYTAASPHAHLAEPFATVSMSDTELKAYDTAALEAEATRLARAAEHTGEITQHHKKATIEAGALAEKKHHKHHHHHHITYPAKDSHSKVVPYVVRDHAWNHAEEDHTNDATWEAETDASAGPAYR